MNRRRFLALARTTATATTAGCQFGYRTYLDRRVEILDTDAEGVEFDATVEYPYVSRMRTAEVRATFGNSTDGSVTLTTLWKPQEPYPSRVTSDPVLAYRMSQDGELRDGPTLFLNTWEPDPSRCHRADAAFPLVVHGVDLDPGERVSTRYYLWTLGGVDACFPPGRYRAGELDGMPSWRLDFRVTVPD